jgi:cytochrome P450
MWLFLVVLVILALLAEWLHFNLVHKTAPGPWGWPIIGSLPVFALGQGRLVEVFARYGRENPLTFAYRIFGIGNIIQTNNAEDVIHMLHGNFDNYPKPQLLAEMMGDLFGKDGIFVANGAAWTEQRKAGSKGFKLKSIRQSVEIFGEETHKAVRVLEGCEGQAVDVMKLMASLTLSAFTTLALSEENFSEVRLNDDSPFAFHFNRAVRCTSNRFQNPFWKLGPRVWRGERELRESLVYLDQRIYAVVAKARSRTGEEPEDMLSSFMEYIPNATDSYLRDILLNFIIAGRGKN